MDYMERAIAKAIRQAKQDIRSKIITDTKGRQYRVKHVMTDKEARASDIFRDILRFTSRLLNLNGICGIKH